MTSSQRIALNTLATFTRNVFSMALGIFSGRWVLQALGPVDFGLMGVVGALITFVAFFGNLMSSAAARFFAFSIGCGDLEDTRRWFNTSLSIHLTLPLLLVLIGWPLGEYAIIHYINIPPNRLMTARWVFRFSLLASLWQMSATPFLGMYTAKQRIAERSLWDIIYSLAKFVFIFSLTRYRGDAWLLYSAGIVTIGFSVGIVQVIRARLLFPECRIRLAYWWDRRRLREIFTYSGWNLFGWLGGLLRGQGSAILLNRFFSPDLHPHVNASYTLGQQVSGHTQTLSSALLSAFTPEITALEGRGERSQMLRQSYRASKFGVYLVLLFAIPVMLEIDTLLDLWLVKPPPLAGTFCCLMLVSFIVEKITFGLMVAIHARGRIAGYQMVQGTLVMLALPLAWLLLRLGCGPTAVGWAFLISTGVCSFGRLFWARYLVGASIRIWLRMVLMPCTCVLLGSLFCGRLLIACWPVPSFWRLCAVTGVTLASSLSLGWFVAFTKDERYFIVINLRKTLHKAGLMRSRA